MRSDYRPCRARLFVRHTALRFLVSTTIWTLFTTLPPCRLVLKAKDNLTATGETGAVIESLAEIGTGTAWPPDGKRSFMDKNRGQNRCKKSAVKVEDDSERFSRDSDEKEFRNRRQKSLSESMIKVQLFTYAQALQNSISLLGIFQKA
ncbi:hypothetical protein B0H19DRAFT_1072200 [Mycena capillaripes]|nr:hypothetical protein B0H19DRAFT_1072200 [Mycena capillaripes]